MADFPSLFEFIDNKLSVSDLVFLSGIQCSCAVPVCTSWTYSTPLWTSSRNVPVQTPGLSRVSRGCCFSEGFPNKTGFAESQQWCSCQCFIFGVTPAANAPGCSSRMRSASRGSSERSTVFLALLLFKRYPRQICLSELSWFSHGLSPPWFFSVFNLGALDFCSKTEWGFTVISLPEVVAFPRGWGDPWVCVQVPMCCCVTVNMNSVLL